jgi:bidirectional [NiFe] hydrogenase diaphorase subunit
VTGKNAIGFVDRGINKEISFIPRIAAIECNDCKECFPLCPTSYLQAAYVLTESLAFPSKNVVSNPVRSKSVPTKPVTGE